MKKTIFLICLILLLSPALYPSLTQSQEAWKLGAKYGGRVYDSPSDPQYVSYEREAKAIILDQIRTRYGVELNGDLVSSDQLLEIEALLRFKRSHESVERILSQFPGVLLRSPSS